MPAMKAAANPLCDRKRTTWSAPHARATSAVPSSEPSSMTSTSMTSMPSICFGRSLIVPGKVVASLRHGIWMTSFVMASRGLVSDELLDHTVPRHLLGALEPDSAE